MESKIEMLRRMMEVISSCDETTTRGMVPEVVSVGKMARQVIGLWDYQGIDRENPMENNFV